MMDEIDEDVLEAVEVVVEKVGQKGRGDPQRLQRAVERNTDAGGMSFYDALDWAQDQGLLESEEDMGTSHKVYVPTADGREAAEHVVEHGELPAEYLGDSGQMAVDGGPDPQYDLLQDTFEQVDEMLSQERTGAAETAVDVTYDDGSMEKDLLEAYIEQES